MTTLTPQRPAAQQKPISASSSQQPESGLSVVPRILFWLAAAFLMLAPVIATVIVDTSGGGHHLELGHFFLVIPASIFALSAIVLGFIARPERAVSRKLQTWIYIALGTLLAGVGGTALAPFLAPSPGSVSFLGGIDVTLGFLGLTGYIVAFIGTLIVRARARKR